MIGASGSRAKPERAKKYYCMVVTCLVHVFVAINRSYGKIEIMLTLSYCMVVTCWMHVLIPDSMWTRYLLFLWAVDPHPKKMEPYVVAMACIFIYFLYLFWNLIIHFLFSNQPVTKLKQKVLVESHEKMKLWGVKCALRGCLLPTLVSKVKCTLLGCPCIVRGLRSSSEMWKRNEDLRRRCSL
jgi:hypothetical protein